MDLQHDALRLVLLLLSDQDAAAAAAVCTSWAQAARSHLAIRKQADLVIRHLIGAGFAVPADHDARAAVGGRLIVLRALRVVIQQIKGPEFEEAMNTCTHLARKRLRNELKHATCKQQEDPRAQPVLLRIQHSEETLSWALHYAVCCEDGQHAIVAVRVDGRHPFSDMHITCDPAPASAACLSAVADSPAWVPWKAALTGAVQLRAPADVDAEVMGRLLDLSTEERHLLRASVGDIVDDVLVSKTSHGPNPFVRDWIVRSAARAFPSLINV